MARHVFGNRWRYRAWDDTQQPLAIEGDDVLASIADDLMYHGDANAALRRALRDGLQTSSGERIEGMRDLLERLRQRREELEQRVQPDGVVQRIADELEEIVSLERGAIDETVALEMSAGDPDHVGELSARAAEQHAQLDTLPSDPAGKIHELRDYDFVSSEARERFEKLLSELQHDLIQLQLDQAAASISSSSPEDRAHLRDALDALNRMLEQRAEGQDLDPSFEEFMANYGDVFPGGAASLDELLEQLAARMAASSALLASMSPEQRAQLEALGAELLEDMDLAWQLDRLGANLRDSLPNLSWDQPMQGSPSGSPGMEFSLGDASAAVGELAELSLLEQFLKGASEPAALAEVDFDAVEAQLGREARISLERLAQLSNLLEASGDVERRGNRLELTPKGLRRLGQHALSELFANLRKDRFGGHQVPTIGFGQDEAIQTKPYEFGDPFRLDVEQTLRNAIVRTASSPEHAMQLPLRLSPDDFAVGQTEQVTAASTVLAVDLSLSMPMRHNFLAAKKVAVALQALIETRYPRDYLGLVGFSATARELRKNELPELSWDFAYGTNLEHALMLSRRMLANKIGSKQIILITDGEPTAHLLEDGRVFFNYPTVPETLEATYMEVMRCTREHVVINAFVLDATRSLRMFVEEMTRRNRGRAFFTSPETLGEYVLVDFVEHRRATTRRVRPA